MPAAQAQNRQPTCIKSIDDAVELELSLIAHRPQMDTLLMCDPSYFEVRDVKNAFMAGNVDSVDKQLALSQWENLKLLFAAQGRSVEVLPGQPDLEDMVFTANQVLVGIDSTGQRYVVLGRMRHPSRQREVPYFQRWFESHGYRVLTLPVEPDEELHFEGHGDAIWHPGKQLIWGGYGHRTDYGAYERLSKLVGVPVVTLHLVHDTFYHLDTAFCALDAESVMIYPGAFDSEGLKIIRHFFPRVLEVPEHDANNFACNALCLGKKVLIEKGSAQTCEKLREFGFEPLEVSTSEFMKSGGSVFCLKLEMYGAAGGR